MTPPRAPGDAGEAASEAPLYRRLVDGGLVYDAGHDCIHQLNETAALIWEAWQEGADEAETVRRLCARYEVDADTAGREVRAVVRRLAQGPTE